MKTNFILLLVILSLNTFAQNNKVEYLRKNRFDLNSSKFEFPQKKFQLIGFGAYHGSQKTEKTEIALIKSLVKNGNIKYYLPETDFSIAYYFNKYLKSGDTIMLKQLVEHYGSRVPQDKSISTYEKWKELKTINDKLPEGNKLTVLGIDLLVSYKYTAKHLLELIGKKQYNRKSVIKITEMIKNDTINFFPYSATYSKKVLEDFVKDYDSNKAEFEKTITDKFSFNHIIKNLKETFVDFDNATKRERLMYENYVALSVQYAFNEKPQFARFGFFHLEKQREGKNPSFFVQLIENKIIKREELISVIGYLTESRVLWGRILDDNGKYKDYNTEGGYGIGDYEKEYFLGIDKLKKTKISDMTLFRLNQKNNPYSDGIPDLMEIVMTDEKSNGELVKGKSTTEYLDYAVLISNSKASIPIEEMDM
ncbi:TraB/GumN family protein [Winogradskyella endarachnes]|uniref:Erythromycin esterase family protein n=1 Tax=Winogradskyella endarachnes TaxID=2681965 RepID=A0A6L6UDD1_9FLAO|nr:hypothetical protein [Winogradskyella endarachnes]MUU78932.1 hypothetical protein [Winogradskyella endarachnes]